MSLLFWGITLGVIGKVMLALGVLMAHDQISYAHKINDRVLQSFRTEHTLTIIGIILILIGYTLEMYVFGFVPDILCVYSLCENTIIP